LLLGAADDNGSIATKEKSYATAEFTSNSYMQDYSDFSDPRMYSTTTSQRHASVFSFPLTLSKVDSHSNKTLNAAEFTLSKGNDTQCFTVLGGIYHRSGNAPCGSGTVQTLASDASGQVRIKGLEAHVEYRVKESKQPEGYDPSNTDMVNFTVKVEPRYNDDETPNEVLATEYLYAGASYLQPQGLPAYLRPATNEWVNDVDHVKHTFYAHEIDVLNGKTSQDVDAIAPFPWDTLAKTGAGVLLLLLVAGLLVLIGALMQRRKTEDSRQIHGVTA
jgi:LPXTG-motif cell wall-anchored protein